MNSVVAIRMNRVSQRNVYSIAILPCNGPICDDGSRPQTVNFAPAKTTRATIYKSVLSRRSTFQLFSLRCRTLGSKPGSFSASGSFPGPSSSSKPCSQKCTLCPVQAVKLALTNLHGKNLSIYIYLFIYLSIYLYIYM